MTKQVVLLSYLRATSQQLLGCAVGCYRTHHDLDATCGIVVAFYALLPERERRFGFRRVSAILGGAKHAILSHGAARAPALRYRGIAPLGVTRARYVVAVEHGVIV